MLGQNILITNLQAWVAPKVTLFPEITARQIQDKVD